MICVPWDARSEASADGPDVGARAAVLPGRAARKNGRATSRRKQSLPRRSSLGLANGCSLGRHAQRVSEPSHLLAPTPGMGKEWSVDQGVAFPPERDGRRRFARPSRSLPGRQLLARKKRGEAVGPTRKGKGTKWFVVADGRGTPIGTLVASASPAESQLAEAALESVVIPRRHGPPKRILPLVIADKGYDSWPLKQRLLQKGTRLVSPNLRTRKSHIEDGRRLRRYKRRWKVERTISWVGTWWRRLTCRWERLLSSWNGFLHAAMMIICLRRAVGRRF